ncbi:MAG: glycosyl hydrolase 53 family protein [Bacteroidales bacterium]|nr:glycosyl hydrolase 53 family protein [Bacteroidales bacterium]
MKRTFTLLLLLILSWTLKAQQPVLGVDLSYANQMDDCGAVYKQYGNTEDIYQIFKNLGTKVIRYRLWYHPDSTNYSTLSDDIRAIRRAKAAGFEVLLDFHYSDTWADPGKQTRPKAWQGITDLNVLADSVYQYTHRVLTTLKDEGLTPEYVQIGNETNGNIMVEPGGALYPNDWPRNVKLFEAGIHAAHDVDPSIKTILHVANPENGDWWFTDATNNGLTDYDIIGLSYYPQWHKLDIAQVGQIVKSLKAKFNKPVWIVETGYPWTDQDIDSAANILTSSSVLAGYPNPPTVEGQKNFLLNLNYAVISNGGMGTIYWDPDWVSTPCKTEWGQGSHYENATFFDFNGNLLSSANYFNYDFSVQPKTTSEVTFEVDMAGVDTLNGVYVTGDFTGIAWQFKRMTYIGNDKFRFTTTLQKGDSGAYIFTRTNTWNGDYQQYQETVPSSCALKWGTHRFYDIQQDVENYAFKWSSCEPVVTGVVDQKKSSNVVAYPNPFNDRLNLRNAPLNTKKIKIYSISGKLIRKIRPENTSINTSHWSGGMYVIRWLDKDNHVLDSLKVIKTLK